MVRFPDQLPNPLASGYKQQKFDGVHRTEMEDGYMRNRLVFDWTPTEFSVSYRLTDVQAQLFVAWHKFAINGGQDTFIIPLLMVDGMVDRVAKFTQMYKGPERIQPCHWEFDLSIQVLDEATDNMDPDDLLFPDEIIYSSLFDINMNRDWPEAQ